MKPRNDGTPFLVAAQQSTASGLWRVVVGNPATNQVWYSTPDQFFTEQKAFEAGVAWLKTQGWNVAPLMEALRSGKQVKLTKQKYPGC